MHVKPYARTVKRYGGGLRGKGFWRALLSTQDLSALGIGPGQKNGQENGQENGAVKPC